MTETLCKLAPRDSDKSKRGKRLKRTRFTCDKCGRQAAKKKRLCKPKRD